LHDFLICQQFAGINERSFKVVKKSERLSIVALIAIATLILSGSPSSAAIPGSNCPKIGATQFRQSMQMDQSNIARANTQISSVRQFIQGNCADESLIAGL